MASSRHLQRLFPVLVVLCAALAVAGWLGFRALQAQQQLMAARTDLTTAREALLDRRLDAAQAAITAAGERAARARRLTHDPVWRLASVLPRLGATPASVSDIAAAADDLARQVLPAAFGAAEAVDPAALRGPDGAIDLAMLKAATPTAAASADRAEQVLAELEQPTSSDSLDLVDQRRQDLTAQAAELAGTLRGAARALQLAPTLLGEDRPRRYLMLVQQPGESRGTGGLIGGFVEVEAFEGRLSVLSQGSNADLRNGPIPVPAGVPQEYVDLYGGLGAFTLWQNANLSPDLPVVARVLEARWVAQGGQPLDGVAMLDAVALSAILEGSGPVDVDGRQVEPADLVEYLGVGQYRDFQPADSDTAIDRPDLRKDHLEDIAAVAARRLAGGGGDTAELLGGLVEAVRSGHLRLASDDPELGPALAEAEVDGALPRGSAPVAYAVVHDVTAGKLQHFLDRKVTYTAGGCSGERRRSTITVELRNDVPEGDLPLYLTTRVQEGERIHSRSSAVSLSVYGTRGASFVRAAVDGRPTAPEDPAGPVLVNLEESGLPFWNLNLELPPGQTRTLTLELDEPVVAGEARVPEQPLARLLQREVSVPAC